MTVEQRYALDEALAVLADCDRLDGAADREARLELGAIRAGLDQLVERIVRGDRA